MKYTKFFTAGPQQKDFFVMNWFHRAPQKHIPTKDFQRKL
jgi:hypothetical protein